MYLWTMLGNQSVCFLTAECHRVLPACVPSPEALAAGDRQAGAESRGDLIIYPLRCSATSPDSYRERSSAVKIYYAD